MVEVVEDFIATIPFFPIPQSRFVFVDTVVSTLIDSFDLSSPNSFRWGVSVLGLAQPQQQRDQAGEPLRPVLGVAAFCC